jgi:hypothetical protein
MICLQFTLKYCKDLKINNEGNIKWSFFRIDLTYSKRKFLKWNLYNLEMA